MRGSTAAAIAAAVFLLGVGCRESEKSSPMCDDGLARAIGYLLSQQSPDGAWRSTTYGTLAGGATLTPPVLKTVLLAPGHEQRREQCERAVSYLRGFIGDDGSIPADTVLDYPVYTASLSAIVLHRLSDHPGRDAWLEYLRRYQLTEQLGWTHEDTAYGGWGYAVRPARRLAERRPPFDSDLSSTLFAVGALRLSGVAPDDPVIRHALAFVIRCQNFGDERGFDDGGFFLTPTNAAQNKAGIAGRDRHGVTRYHSYGSATADGVRALLRCGLAADHPRVRAAQAWLERTFTVRTNPGTYTAALEPDRQAALYYYCWSISHAFRLLGVTTIEQESRRIDWRQELAEALLQRQRPDGSWHNDHSFLKEDDPLIATTLAAVALANCQATR